MLWSSEPVKRMFASIAMLVIESLCPLNYATWS